jgi:phosphomannomutase/phosphoglucomutase
MKVFENIASKIGLKPINFALLLSACFIIFFSLNAFYQPQQQLQTAQLQNSHQQQAHSILNLLDAKVNALQSTLAAAATSDLLSFASFSYNSGSDIIEQKPLLKLFPGANNVCVALPTLTQPQNSACLDVSFATLNSIRQAEKNTQAPIAVMKVGTEEAHLLLAHRLDDKYQQFAGVLLVSYPAEYVNNLLPSPTLDNLYFELQQGTKRVIQVSSRGNSAYRQGEPLLSKTVDGTYLNFAYWIEPVAVSNLPMAVLLMIFGSLVVCWLLKDIWAYFLLKVDSHTLSQQITDLKDNKMKPEYALISKVLENVKDDIRSIAYEKKITALKSQSTNNASPNELVVEDLDEIEPDSVDQRLFGSYDIRETKDVSLDRLSAKLIGKALGSEAKDQGQQALIIARDERHVSEQLAQSLIDGVLSTGCNVIDIGSVASPLFFYGCEKLGSASGAMVTTSMIHQPVSVIKCVINKRALTEDALRGLYSRIEQQKFQSGKGSSQSSSVVDSYLKAISDKVSISRSISVVIDCGNTITSLLAPKLFTSLGCQVIEVNCQLGEQPSHEANPSNSDNLELLANHVKQHGAELGICFDNDGDRLAVVDANGELVAADRLMVMLAQSVLIEDPQATILYDVKSTSLIEEVVSRSGANPVMSPSGYAIIKNKAFGVGAKLAGEYSGHIYFNDRWFGFEDGFYAAARLLEFLANDPLERSPSEVFSALPKRFATPEILVELADNNVHFINELQSQAEFAGAKVITIDGLRVEYPDAWGVIRVSNTQQMLSLRFEASNQQALDNIKQQFRQQMLQIKPTLGLSF